MKFTKMHGLGNDYIYVFGQVPSNISELSKRLSDRHLGVGSDGMIYICPSETADFKMRIFNADGSEAMMCGNGIRCVGKYVYDKGYTDKTHLNIETLSGIKTLHLSVCKDKVRTVSVDMGQSKIFEKKSVAVDGNNYVLTPVSMGNFHAVIFVDDINDIQIEKVGPIIEHCDLFKDGVNVEFVQVLSRSELRMRVWERGSGVTFACGTGACASVSAAISNNYCDYDTDVSVILDGGTLHITVEYDNTVTMRGPAETVYEGETVEKYEGDEEKC